MTKISKHRTLQNDFMDFLDGMLEAATYAMKFVDGMSKEEFNNDIKTYFAAVRAIELICQAAVRIPEHIQEKNLEIPWRHLIFLHKGKILGYRSDPGMVYDTVIIFIPKLITTLKNLINEIKNSGEGYSKFDEPFFFFNKREFENTY